MPGFSEDLRAHLSRTFDGCVMVADGELAKASGPACSPTMLKASISAFVSDRFARHIEVEPDAVKPDRLNITITPLHHFRFSFPA